MKRNILTLICVVAGLLAATSAFGQGQITITTRKDKIKDFPTKITKAVVPSQAFLAEAFKESVASAWTVSPYEFCTMEEFEQLKTSDKYYFLLVVQGQNRKESEPGIQMLTLVKGGADVKDVNDMIELVTFPLCAADSPSGREMIFLPAILKIMQEQNTSADTRLLSGMTVYISEDDLADQVGENELRSLKESLVIVDEDEADDTFTDGDYNTAVSYVIAPEDPGKGSVCYKLIFSADTHELLYFKKHRISARNGRGFLDSDLKDINSSLK